MREFYYSKNWRDAYEGLQGPQHTPSVKWWDDGNDEEQSPSLDDPTRDPSVRGRLQGLVETFAVGWPRAKLVRKTGCGMDPPFKRMRDSYSGVVEMRTQATRTFGFFVKEAVFVALILDLADNTHKNLSLYDKHAKVVMSLLARMDASEKDETSDVEKLLGECS